MKPSDIARIRHNLGLDKPIYIQYILWLKNVLKGDLGYSLINSRPISTQIIERLPATLLLIGSSLLISLVLGIILGVISAVNKNKLIDNILSVISYIVYLYLVLVCYDTNIHFSVNLKLLPSVGMHTIGVDSRLDVLKHLILPCTVLSFGNISVITRYIRSNVISELSEDYVMIAYAKGLSKKEYYINMF